MTERSFFGALNRIDGVIENACGVSWWARIKLAVPAAGSSLWMLIVPQPDEILEEYLDPKNSRKAPRTGNRDDRKRRKVGRFGKARRTFSDALNVDSLIADRLPGVEWFNSRRIGQLEHMFWTGLNASERVLWYWLVVDAAENFAYEWHSGIMESRFCTTPATSWVRCHTPTYLSFNLDEPPLGGFWELDDVEGPIKLGIHDVRWDLPQQVHGQWTWFVRNTFGASTKHFYFKCVLTRKDGSIDIQRRDYALEYMDEINDGFTWDDTNVVQIEFQTSDGDFLQFQSDMACIAAES